MTQPAGTGLPAYGLAMSPFDEKRALDPLCSAADRASVSPVDGWRDLRDAENLISRRVAGDRPVFFVIAGASSTGRSSLANYLVHLWAQARGVTSESIVVQRRDPGPDAGVYDAGTQIMEWAQGLLLRDDKLDLTETTQKLLEDLTDSSTLFKFAQSLRGVDQDLRTPTPGSGKGPRYLAAILERGKGDDLIRKVRDCFQATRAIVIVTIDASRDTANLLNQVDQVLSPDAGLRVNVGPISGDDVVTVIERRWSAIGQHVENPFNQTAAEVFDSPRPIKRVVKLLHRMLRIQQHLHKGDPWPASRNLGFFDRDAMRGLLEEIDEKVPAGQEV
jgi:hypothetical protein